VTGALKGVRLDAEGGAASLDDEKTILAEISEMRGESTVDGPEANISATLANSKKVSHDGVFSALLILSFACAENARMQIVFLFACVPLFSSLLILMFTKNQWSNLPQKCVKL
jgi:hypothetical protein